MGVIAKSLSPVNQAGSVRGPSHAVKAGMTLVLAPEEARH
jgi:hypothetical protein